VRHQFSLTLAHETKGKIVVPYTLIVFILHATCT